MLLPLKCYGKEGLYSMHELKKPSKAIYSLKSKYLISFKTSKRETKILTSFVGFLFIYYFRFL